MNIFQGQAQVTAHRITPFAGLPHSCHWCQYGPPVDPWLWVVPQFQRWALAAQSSAFLHPAHNNLRFHPAWYIQDFLPIRTQKKISGFISANIASLSFSLFFPSGITVSCSLTSVSYFPYLLSFILSVTFSSFFFLFWCSWGNFFKSLFNSLILYLCLILNFLISKIIFFHFQKLYLSLYKHLSVNFGSFLFLGHFSLFHLLSL